MNKYLKITNTILFLVCLGAEAHALLVRQDWPVATFFLVGMLYLKADRARGGRG